MHREVHACLGRGRTASNLQREVDSWKHEKGNSESERKGEAGQPISLRPLSFDEAVAGLAQVKPPEKEAGKKLHRKNKRAE